ncbi:hypothetical protein [Duganella qianjiadongensis]|uniref:Uncharacterized protein n=1 Tax=Duganella qianjiadongensis TaxID=2692176 RepID=A0ABW9VLR4_9BURK|nr:hypothetical protein [Duganella qianjiadongensis]MYM39429.1 hypothetical protein [Duganella qianjiadongensis]
MTKLTDDEEYAFDELMQTDPEAVQIFRECCAEMSDEDRERFTRFTERLASLLAGLNPTKDSFICTSSYLS